MATLAGLRGRVRLRLEESVEALWSDAELDEALGATLEEYSHLFPREERLELAHPGGAGPLAVPGETFEVLRVTLASGWTVPRRSSPRDSSSGEELAWESFAGALHFSGNVPAQALVVWRLTGYEVGQVPETDSGLLVLGGVWRALQQRGVQEYRRGGLTGWAGEPGVTRAAGREYRDALGRRRRRVRSRVMGTS
jgi:hypothetical protein